MNIYQIGNDEGVKSWLESRDHKVTCLKNPLETAELLPNPELVVFTGGSDVWPALYGEKNTDSDVHIRRDIEEMIWFMRFRHVLKVGICRGGQFLNVMCGGTMEQDHKYHAIAGLHDYYCDITGRKYRVTSTHHQVMQTGINGQLLGYASGMRDDINTPECIYYARDNAVCFQPHPEYGVGDPNNSTVQALNNALALVWRIQL